jgi:hypothetical protein
MLLATSTAAPVETPTLAPISRWSTGRGANHLAEGALVDAAAFGIRTGFSKYGFSGGIATAYLGVEILVEQGGTRPPQALLDTVRGYIDTLGPGERKLLTQVEVLAGACPMDAYWRDRYKIPDYYVRALTGGGVTQLWRGDTRTARVFQHEQAHLLDFAGYVPSGAWRSAVANDDANLQALLAQGWTLTDLPVDRFDFDRDHLRLAPGGITGYAEFARSNAGTLQEDIAEAVAWSRLSTRVGAIARATRVDGAARDLMFEDLFPARAKLVAAARAKVNGA